MNVLSTLERLVPFLEQYPSWVKGIIALWIIFSAVLIVILLVVPRNTVEVGSTDQETPGPPRQLTSSYSHWEAFQSKELELDCSPYRMVANPNVYVYSRIACEALAELRSNMGLLARYHTALEGSNSSVPEPLFVYKATEKYIAQEKFAEPYGPKKEKLERLIEELRIASSTLSEARTKADLIKWQSEDRFTVDDLFISHGFLDWLIGYQVKDKLTPAEMSKFGPFYDRAFPYPNRQGTVTFAVRDLKHYAYSEEGVQYVTILSAFD